MLILHEVNVDIVTFKETERRQLFRYAASGNTTFLFRADGTGPTPTANNGYYNNEKSRPANLLERY